MLEDYSLCTTVCSKFWTSVCLCPKIGIVVEYIGTSFMSMRRFSSRSSWCVWCLQRYRLLSSRLNQTKWVLVVFPSSQSKEWILASWSTHLLQYEAWVHQDTYCNFSNAALGKLYKYYLALHLCRLSMRWSTALSSLPWWRFVRFCKPRKMATFVSAPLNSTSWVNVSVIYASTCFTLLQCPVEFLAEVNFWCTKRL